MASTNHHHQESSSTSQRQQQELIKLLTQHFYQQFYQPSNENPAAAISRTHNVTTRSNGNQISSNSQMQQQQHVLDASILANYSYQQQQQIVQFVKNERPLLGSGGINDLSNGLNLMAANAGTQMLINNSNRSQLTNCHPNVGANQYAPKAESFADLASLRSRGLNPYSMMNDMNIFEALNLNLTSNQLVLSLQQQQHQQSLFQASAARQFEMRNEIDEIVRRQESRRSSNDTLSNLTDHDDNNHNPDSREMLKFSINTILGRGSPDFAAVSATSHQSANMNTSVDSSFDSRMCQANDDKIFNSASNQAPRDQSDPRQRQMVKAELTGDDCDPLAEDDSNSNGSSLLTNPTLPSPQTTSSILFNNHQQLLQNHRSVANLTNTAGQPLLMPTGNSQQQLGHQASHQQTNHQQHPPLSFLTNSSAFPWTVAARGKPRRGMMRRAVFSDSQRVGLEKRFQLQKYISKPDRKKLAEKLGLRDSQVKIWFQNRRMKWRNSKERELLSAGGSREQTLPTRNNPNPDLSDVGETIKRLTSDGSPTNHSMMNS